MKMYRMYKGRLMHINQIATLSRKNTVKNCTIAPVDKKNLVEIEEPWGKVLAVKGEVSWKQEHHKQPKSLRKKYKKKYYMKGSHELCKIISHPSDYAHFKNYPYNLPKMSRVEYYEKLVEHKLTKWERKNPKPMDMFTEDVEKWKQLRETAKERIRDFVVSMYDKLPILGNKVDYANKRIKSSTIGEVKDIDGKGHDVSYPKLSVNDALFKIASKKAQQAMDKDASILDADLMNHKRNQKRPLNVKRAA